MVRIAEGLREVYRVSEWRDGCVWKTEHVRYEWVPLVNEPKRPAGADEFYRFAHDAPEPHNRTRIEGV